MVTLGKLHWVTLGRKVLLFTLNYKIVGVCQGQRGSPNVIVCKTLIVRIVCLAVHRTRIMTVIAQI